uniref:Uncharacterized protein n=1 Tax=Peronospora matthiolae TaxID=2874970 RepID=A0AAV1UDG5_9STRA
MKVLQINLLGILEGLVSPLPRLRTVIEAVTALVTLLREAKVAAGKFELSTLSDLGFKSIKSMLEKLHKRLASLVGTATRHNNVSPAQPIPMPSSDRQMKLQDFVTQPQARPQLDKPKVTRRPPPANLPPGIQDADERSSPCSSALDQYDQMPLGPAGAAMLQDCARGGATN